MSYIKEQLKIMPINTLIELNNKVADRLNLDNKIYYFDEDDINNCFASPWELFNCINTFTKKGFKTNGIFTRNSSGDIVHVPVCDIRDEEKSPIDFKAIEDELKENELLAYDYSISCEDYDEYPVDKFIAEWACKLPDSNKEDIVNTILEALQIQGGVEDGIVHIERLFEREHF